MTALYIVGDVFDKLAELRRRRVRAALVLCSPPFLALRSYLPDGHPLKAREIGSEATPAAFVDVMLALVAECAHVLAPWGSVALELGDTYAGSGGAGGDYDLDGLRAGQNAFDGSAARTRSDGNGKVFRGGRRGEDKQGTGWPRDKSLAGIPEAVMLSLAYGYNVLDRRGPDSPAGRWMIRNFKPWIRSNPPVGALGDKERPATSYVIVASRDPQRYFDLDAVRTPHAFPGQTRTIDRTFRTLQQGERDPSRLVDGSGLNHPAGAPPRDWCHSVDMVLDAELDRMAGKTGGEVKPGSVLPAGRLGAGDGTQNNGQGRATQGALTVGARGVHLRRALERAGILTTLDAIDQSPKGYRGAHYAVWPPELVRLLVDEMCPRRVCTVCGQPSRRITAPSDAYAAHRGKVVAGKRNSQRDAERATNRDVSRVDSERVTVGWSDCGCPGADRWQPGIVLDPFVGSGTTLSVCSGMGRESIGIDLDYTNVGLAVDRVGVFLAVEWPEPDLDLLATRAIGPGSPHPATYDRWRHLLDSVRADLVEWALGWVVAAVAHAVGVPFETEGLPAPRPRPSRRSVAVAGQGDLFD